MQLVLRLGRVPTLTPTTIPKDIRQEVLLINAKAATTAVVVVVVVVVGAGAGAGAGAAAASSSPGLPGSALCSTH